MASPADIADQLSEYRIEMNEPPLPADIHFGLRSVEMMEEAEDTNFWPWNRRKLVTSLVRRYAKPPCGFLDIGCGNGALLRHLAEMFPSSEATGIDGHLETLKYCRKRNPDAHLILQNIAADEWRKTSKRYDVITIMDVLEHLDDPVAVLRHAKSLLADDGVLIVSMPAFQTLWSKRDVFVGHRKRYDRSSTAAMLEAGGFRVIRTNYLFSYLWLPAWLHRKVVAPLCKSSGEAIERVELVSVPGINLLLKCIGAVEIAFANVFPVPFGTSVYGVAGK